MLFYIFSCEIRTSGPANNWHFVSTVMTCVIDWWGGWLQDGCKPIALFPITDPNGFFEMRRQNYRLSLTVSLGRNDSVYYAED